MFKNTLKSSSAMALLLGAGIATPVFAQDSELVQLEEIIVTAQRREQSLQDVPISVTAITGNTLENFVSAGDDILALAGRVPSLNAESSNGRVAPRFYIRGLGNTDFDLAASQPVSVVMDDIVMENVVLKSFPLFDVDRVEVLRGPQGTLFGRNTPAGIVKIDTVNPNGETEGYVSGSYGTLGSATVRMGYGIKISDTISARIAGIYQHRDDYIDNSFTGENGALGGFNEYAGRIKILFEPSENFDALLSAQVRSLSGTSAIFRANIADGGGKANANFDRDVVGFDGGDGNNQEYDTSVFSLKMNYDLDGVIFTSITAFATADGFSRGDIDGGNPGGPGFIPFQSDTQDNVDDTDQFTQELRLASDNDSDMTWQLGFFYFDSDLQVTTNPFFVPASTVKQVNEAWAAFGQFSYNMSDATTLTAGIRYTEDDKKLDGVFPLFGSVFHEEVSSERVSWDIAINHAVSDDVSIYARVASGFRAPSIQGRDIAFFGAPSVAKEETILSFETGFKGLFMEKRLRLNGAAYFWTMDDQQLSAVGAGGNFIQLINADKTKGYGFELEAEYLVTENFRVTSGLSYNHTEIKDSTLAVGTCAQCNVVDPLNTNGFALIDGNSLPQAPNWLFNVTAEYRVDVGDGEFYIATDWFIEGKKNLFLYESTVFNTEGDFEGGLRAGYVWNDGGYEVFAYGRNITNEVNKKGAIDFNNNTAYVNEPSVWGLGIKANF